MRPLNKLIIGLDNDGELEVIETDESEEGMFISEDEEKI